MKTRLFAGIALSISAGIPVSARQIELKGKNCSLSVDDTRGTYVLERTDPVQRWEGSIGGELNRVMQGEGQDELGKFSTVSFLDGGIDKEIHVYVDRPVVMFNWSSDKALAKPPAEFPDFTKLPPDQHILSYSNKTFSI